MVWDEAIRCYFVALGVRAGPKHRFLNEQGMLVALGFQLNR